MSNDEPNHAGRRVLTRAVGAVGILICVLGLIGVWYAATSVQSIRSQVFQVADQKLAQLLEHVDGLSAWVADAKRDAEHLDEQLASRLKLEAAERIIDRAEFDKKVNGVAELLKQGESIYQASMDAMDGVEQVLELCSALGLEVDQTRFDSIVNGINEVGQQLDEAIVATENLQSRLDRLLEEPEQSLQLLRLTSKIVAAAGLLDTKVASLRSGMENSIQVVVGWNRKFRYIVRCVAVAGGLFLMWMALGQYCLYRTV